MAMRVREVVRVLKANGWRQVRQKGSHRIFRHPECQQCLPRRANATARLVISASGKLDVTRLSESQLDESAHAAMQSERPEVLSA